jgi:hypothetical protein
MDDNRTLIGKLQGGDQRLVILPKRLSKAEFATE